MVSRIVIPKNQGPRGSHVLVGIRQAVDCHLYIDDLAKVKDRAIHKVEFATYETFICGSFVIEDVRCLKNTAGCNGILNLVEVSLNSQIGFLAPSQPCRVAA